MSSAMAAAERATATGRAATRPYEMDIRFLEWASFWSNIAVVGLGILAAVAAASALYFGARLTTTRTAELDSVRARAAAADERLTEAHDTAAVATGRAAGFEQEAAQLRDRAGALEREVAQLRERATAAEQQLRAAQGPSAPRGLTSAEREGLTRALAAAEPKGPVTVAYVLGDAEAGAFALQVREILIDAGWPTTRMEQVIFAPRVPEGIEVHIQSIVEVPSHAAVLQKAFEAAAIELRGREIANLDEGEVRITVGTRPH